MDERSLHRQYIYLSARLLRQLYDQASSHQRVVHMNVDDVSLGVPGLNSNVKLKKTSDQPENIYWLAEHALKTVRTETGGVFGERTRYLLDELPLTWSSLPILTLGSDDPVAWMYARWGDPTGGDNLVILCGSMDNYVGYVPGKRMDTLGGGWYPSSVHGLEAVLRALRDENPPAIVEDGFPKSAVL
jgi:hypothetical protein